MIKRTLAHVPLHLAHNLAAYLRGNRRGPFFLIEEVELLPLEPGRLYRTIRITARPLDRDDVRPIHRTERARILSLRTSEYELALYTLRQHLLATTQRVAELHHCELPADLLDDLAPSEEENAYHERVHPRRATV